MKRFPQKYNFGWLGDLVSMFFPRVCVACGEALMRSEEVICLLCLADLPRTNLHRLKDNFVCRKFAGRIPVERASAFLVFTPGGIAQSLIHQLKYKGRQDLGERLGRLYAYDLLKDGYPVPDVIVPLPLHAAKRRRRGYNQCDSIVLGMNKHFGTQVQADNVKRVSDNTSQTKKGRWDRWLNVKNIFEVRDPAALRGRRVLLVDDVITTGATLEACGRAVLDAGAAEINFLTLATA